MRVLVTTIPGMGHLLPMVPLVEAMVAAGDEVTVAAHGSLAEHVTRTGASICPVGHDEAAWFERLGARTRGAPGDGLGADRINHYFFPRIFAEIGADDMAEPLAAAAAELRPDVLVFESYALAGPLVASLCGARPVQHLVGPLLDPGVVELADDAVRPLWRSFGIDSPGLAGLYSGATIAICPPSLERFKVPTGAELRLRASALPLRGPEPADRPLVYVTFGTFFDSVGVLRCVLDALGTEPVDVVVTVGTRADPAALGEVPGNVTVERYVPQAELLPRCSAVVHHCGGGTMFGALAHGLPQVVLPQGADNFTNAELLERAGAAIALRAPDVPSVRTAVRRVLGEERFAERARLLAAELAAMPSPGEVAEVLRASVAT